MICDSNPNWLPKPGGLGACACEAAAKPTMLDVQSTLLLRQKLGVGGSLQAVWHYTGGGVYSESVSAFPTRFNVGIFSFIQCVGVIQLLSGFRLEGIALCIASCTFSVPMGGGEFRSLLLYVAFLVFLSLFFFVPI